MYGPLLEELLLTGTGNSITVTWNTTGNGSVSVVETYLGIPGTDIVNVVVDPEPNTGLSVTAPASVCDGDIAIIDVAASQSGVTYQLREGATNIGTAVAGTGGNIGLPSGALTVGPHLMYWPIITGVVSS